jgi:cytochrome P450
VHRIDRDMTDATFDVLQRTIFAGATAQEADVLKRHIGAYLEWTSWDIAYEILRLPPTAWHPRKRAMHRAAEALASTMQAVIARERANGWASGGLMARLGSARDPETQTPMGNEQIAHNLLTFAAAGHETTAKALTWTLYLLARAPDWQQHIRDEVRRIVQHGAIEAHHVDQLIVTTQVLKEAMRLYPPAPIMGRMTHEPINIAGHRLPAGAMLIIPIYAIHRHRALWTDPDAFNPMRFDAALEKQQKRTQFMPFGFGPRTCIGMSFAMIEAVVLLAEMIRSAAFTCREDLAPEPVSRVTLRPRHGMPIAVRVFDRERAA